jgi:hypothetical protein
VTISSKREDQLVAVDALSPALRGCVHEFGYPIVHACLNAGVTTPRAIRVLVSEIWGGARQQGQQSGARNTLDWLLIQAGACINSKTLNRILNENNLAIVPCSPTRAMLDASMKEVSGHNIRCTREEKHRRRLIAAIRAAIQ